MKDYDPDDQVTFWFVIVRYKDGKNQMVKAWSDNKDLVDFYLQFHNSPNYSVRKVSDRYEKVLKIINGDCRNDEIQIGHLITRNRTGKRSSDPTQLVSVPVTEPEMMHLNDMKNTTCSSIVDYSALHDIMPRLKGKYRSALVILGLEDLIRKEIHNASNKFADGIFMDDVMLLLKFFPEEFG